MEQTEFNSLMNEYIKNLSLQQPSSWSQEARLWAESKGIVAGDANNNKMYKNFVTREEAAVFLYRVMNYLAYNDPTQSTSLLSPADQELAGLSQELRSLRSVLNKTNDEEVNDVDFQETVKNTNNAISALYATLNGSLVCDLDTLKSQSNEIQSSLQNILTHNSALTSKTKTDIESLISQLKNTIQELNKIEQTLK